MSVQIAVFDFSSEARTYCSITSGNVCECLTALNHRFRSTNDALDWFNVYVFFLSFFLPFLSLSLSFISFVLSLSLFFFFKWIANWARSMNVQLYIDHTQNNIPGKVRKKNSRILVETDFIQNQMKEVSTNRERWGLVYIWIDSRIHVTIFPIVFSANDELFFFFFFFFLYDSRMF